MDLLLIILPVFMIFFAGWLGQKIIGFDIRSISTVALYIMSPFLAFRTFYSNELTMDYIYIIVFCCLLTLVLIGVVLIVSFITKADRSQFSAMVLGSAFMNSGNYGAPVALFAFGATGFDYAVIVMVFQSFLMSSVGIFFASFGSKQKTSLAESVQSVIRMPVLHGAVIGVIFQLLHIPIPETISDAIGLVADASIPTVMLVLGMQLAEIRVKDVSYLYVSLVSFIRMIASPLIAIGILMFLPVNDLIKSVVILQAAMPSAANTTLFALQFDTEPDLVSFTTLVTTLISIVTIPITIFLLN